MPPEFVNPIPQGQRTLAAIVITDGVGFSARMSTDEELTLGLIRRDLQMMTQICEPQGGHVLKSTGDGLLMYFASAANAMSCAIAIQKQLAELSADRQPKEVLMHRIGVHLGDVFLSDSDVMGNGVNIAARLQTQAEPGGICLSQTVYDVVKSQLPLKALYMGALHLKNIQEPIVAYHMMPGCDRLDEGEAVQNVAAQNTSVSSEGRSNQNDLSSNSANFNSSESSVEQTDSSGFSVTRMAEDWTPSLPVAKAPFQQDAISTGELIHDRYRIQKSLGQGGFGRTYLAKDIHRFDDLCVLKEFMPLNTSNYVVEKARILFEREAKALYQLKHPQIPKFLAWFTYARRLFIVQEYVNGYSYSRLLQKRLQQSCPFSETEVIQWLYDLLIVLDYLHNQGIVHRDISTDNVMQPDNSPKPVLIDFGLVKQTVSDVLTKSTQQTPSSEEVSKRSFVGKLGYAPPEQIRMGQCFPSSDLYALAVTALVLLTGRQPNLLIDPNSLDWNWRSHVEVSDAFAQLISRMLNERPSDRYSTASAVLCAIHDSPLIHQITLRPIETQIQSQACAAERVALSSQSVSDIPPASATSSLSAEFLETCRTALIQCIGPMANYLLVDLQGNHPNASPERMVQLLVQEIPDIRQAKTFEAVMQEALRSESQSSSISSLNPEFIKRCQQELAQCIGPMAGFILDDVMMQIKPGNHQELIRAIAMEIPDPKKAKDFEDLMQSL